MGKNDLVNGKTKLIGLVGNPVEHSISPQLHNTLSMEFSKNLIYVPFRVEEGFLRDAVNGLRAINVLGFNVTIPYKTEIIGLLDEVSEEALLMGAVNTVKNIDGKLIGYNTDADGFLNSFIEETGEGFKDKNVLIIGAGGTARALAVKIAMEGASNIGIINRTIEKAQNIADIVNENVKNVVNTYNFKNLELTNLINKTDIIINTTSVGMYPNIESTPIQVDFRKDQIVYDVIYNPYETKLLSEAKKSGCKTVNGLGMLIYQGIKAYEVWSGVDIRNDLAAKVKNICIEEFK